MVRGEAAQGIEVLAARHAGRMHSVSAREVFKKHRPSRSEPRSWPARTIASYVVMPASMVTTAQADQGCL